MIILKQLQDFFEQLDQKQFQRYVLIFFSIIILSIGFIVYRYFTTISHLQRQIQEINKQRTTVKELLERYEIVKQQQAEVDALLEKDKDFKIAGYFNTIINNLNLTQNKTREPETLSEELENGYTEIKLYASFNNLNTQKLAQLLDTLEQNERIYTKELEIYKPEDQTTSINVNLSIATLEPKLETEEVTE